MSAPLALVLVGLILTLTAAAAPVVLLAASIVLAIIGLLMGLAWPGDTVR